jgi:putative addiction module component (TIGR02574 family)
MTARDNTPFRETWVLAEDRRSADEGRHPVNRRRPVTPVVRGLVTSLLGCGWSITIAIMSSASDIPLDGMTVPEKLVLMERLWADLSRRPTDVPSPDWHGDVLAQRMADVREGRAHFVEWDDAKKRLRDRLK